MESTKTEDGVLDPIILRNLDCEDREMVMASISMEGESGWLQNGRLPDGRYWGVEGLTFGAARLHVGRAETWGSGASDQTWDYCNPVVATLALFEWEGQTAEPRWWRRCNQTGRRRTYKSDGSYREEVRGY